MKMEDGSRTICTTLRGIRTKVAAHLADRGAGLKNKTLAEIDDAIEMAKRMQAKLRYYKSKEQRK